jgi:hypothetical protein
MSTDQLNKRRKTVDARVAALKKEAADIEREEQALHTASMLSRLGQPDDDQVYEAGFRQLLAFFKRHLTYAEFMDHRGVYTNVYFPTNSMMERRRPNVIEVVRLNFRKLGFALVLETAVTDSIASRKRYSEWRIYPNVDDPPNTKPTPAILYGVVTDKALERFIDAGDDDAEKATTAFKTHFNALLHRVTGMVYTAHCFHEEKVTTRTNHVRFWHMLFAHCHWTPWTHAGTDGLRYI